MPFEVRITGIAKEKGKVVLKVEPRWYDQHELMEDDRFTVTNESGNYFDYDADFTLEDMRALHEHFRPAATSGVYESEEWQVYIRPLMKKLDQALYTHFDQYDRFHVNVYEW